jgi:UbiD family decarboxylase
MSMPVAEVKAITMKKGAMMQGIFPGHPEHWNLGGIPKEGSVYSVIRRNIPAIAIFIFLFALRQCCRNQFCEEGGGALSIPKINSRPSLQP